MSCIFSTDTKFNVYFYRGANLNDVALVQLGAINLGGADPGSQVRLVSIQNGTRI